VHPSAVSSCRQHVRSALAILEREITEAGFEIAVASSGTAESVARMVHAASGADELRTFNCFEFGRDELDAVVARLIAAPTVAARRRIPGLDPARADIILAGALVLEGVAHSYGVERFTFSDFALREGVLLDTIQREHGTGLHELRDVARRSVRQLAARCDDDPRHSEHVARLAVQLFDATRLLHGLDDACRDHLEAGALLANVGLVISHSKHHLHSYYVIRNSELVGFTDPEIEIIAQVARYHRKSAPKPQHPEFARLTEHHQQVVRVLAGILRVAIGLDRSHDGRVQRVSVAKRRGALVVEAHGAPGVDLGLELYAAGERSDLLAEALGRKVVVSAG
jgi:exopolyphosphatase/guanosine-5'-triphosphate,3'-diphosphate pyrophosphatase